jgi:hypothetical protein
MNRYCEAEKGEGSIFTSGKASIPRYWKEIEIPSGIRTS